MLQAGIALIALLMPFVVLAHGGTPSLEQEVDGYIVDIGYDRVGIRPGEEVTFDFDLFTQSGAVSFAPFTHVDIEIAKEGVTIAEATLHNERVHVPVWKYTFPDEGAYVVHVTYRNNEEVMVYATFDLPVGESNGVVGRVVNMATYGVAALLLVLSLIVIGTSLLRKIR